MQKASAKTTESTTCFHCGEDVVEQGIRLEEKHFCCTGCKTVYEILDQKGLCNYYSIESQPGINQKNKIREGKFGFLDDEKIVQKLIHFRQDKQYHVNFYLPQMHCSSCIWLLENLTGVNAGILNSRVDYMKKEVNLIYDNDKTTLRRVVETLTLVGYEPHISLNDETGKQLKKQDKHKIIKIGVAGFCFGNIMMLSFPDYFSSGDIGDATLKMWFNMLNLVLSIPVLFYSASEFFVSAYKGLRQKFLNIDAPIALAILITFGRSLYEIIGGLGSGYLDSMSGIVFFMLVGRYFQNQTYQSISFDRDFTSYFPLGVTTIQAGGVEKQVPVSVLKTGDRIRIHNEEIIPADSILFMGRAHIDYSFVTGESRPVEKSVGEIIYAGGKQVGTALELEVVKEISQSYLTQLWNNDTFKRKSRKGKSSFIHKLSQYFTYVLFSIAVLAAVYWQINDPSKTWQAITAVLIVACPCALLLSATFTNGSMMRALGNKKLYLKDASVIEKIAETDTVVFDKTGTITEQQLSEIVFKGKELNDYTKQLIRSIAAQSHHPLSKSIYASLPASRNLLVKNYQEVRGSGLEATVDNQRVKMGSPEYVLQTETDRTSSSTLVYVSINEKVMGYFLIQNHYRQNLMTVISQLKKNYQLVVLSGDNNSERETLMAIFGKEVVMFFDQKPQDKLNFIKKLQTESKVVMMVGDGLNDAGALEQSDVGIAISDNTNNFSPSCDAILDGDNFRIFDRLMEFCKSQKHIVYTSFAISILYNVVGLSYAIAGELQPVVAAILMPASSITIVLFTTLSSSIKAQRIIASR